MQQQQAVHQQYGSGSGNDDGNVDQLFPKSYSKPYEKSKQQQEQPPSQRPYESWEREYTDSSKEGFGHGLSPTRGDEDLTGF